VVVIGEYRHGLFSSTLRKNLETLFDRLVEGSFVLSVDTGTAYHYAEIRTALRRKGRALPEDDVWIAALTRQHRLPIVSRDLYFDEIDEVERLSW
jgi:tRNA(fMet)-specific endonuclease VapC